MPLESSALLVRLVRREEYRGEARRLLAAARLGTSIDGYPSAESPLIGAAASLNAGEPGAARGFLATIGRDDADQTPVACALSGLAAAMDSNWFPGGAGADLDAGDRSALHAARLVKPSGAPPGDPGDASAAEPGEAGRPASNPGAFAGLNVESAEAAAVIAAATLAGFLLDMRILAQQRRPFPEQMPPEEVFKYITSAGFREPSIDVGTRAHLDLVAADVLWRAGHEHRARASLASARSAYESASDSGGRAATYLMEGDWAMFPLGGAETWGLDVNRTMYNGPATAAPDMGTARTLYDEANAGFGRADSSAGHAAVTLRLACLSLAGGDTPGTLDHLSRAVELSIEARDAGLEKLASLHRSFVRMQADMPSDDNDVGRDIGAWSVGRGSFSFGRGCARLCDERSKLFAYNGDVIRARRTLRTGEAIRSAGAAARAATIPNEGSTSLYLSANDRQAFLVRTELSLVMRVSAMTEPVSVNDWVETVIAAMTCVDAAIAIDRPEAIERTAALLRHAIDVSHRGAPDDRLVREAQQKARTVLGRATVEAVLARARLAEESGSSGSEALFARAHAIAVEVGDRVLAAEVLGSLGRYDEALAQVRPFLDTEVNPIEAAWILVRLHAVEDAGAVMLASALQTAMSERLPLRDAIHLAEVWAALSVWPSAQAVAGETIQRLETWVERLSRDTSRIAARDDFDVLRLYTTAVQARLAAAEAARAAGKSEIAEARVASAFATSDRSRGVPLLEDQLESATASPPAAAAVRRWLADGVRLAEAFEDIARAAATRGDMDAAATVRAWLRIVDAERRVDEAETVVRRIAPAQVAAARRPPPCVAPEKIAAALPPNTMLIQYHAWNDQVIAFALDSRSLRFARRPAPTRTLRANAVRMHAAASSPNSSVPDLKRVAAALAAVLLDPIAEMIADHQRIIIVPFAGMSKLPFQLLPWEGDVLGSVRLVSYLPNSSLVPMLRYRPSLALDSDVLVVGDPSLSPARGLSQLTGARVEAITIADRLHTAPIIGDDATLATVAARLGSARIAHFATHGLYSDDAPNSAQLALSGSDRLSIADLMGIETDLELAVLSACDSGQGRTTGGGEVIGLTRALIAAGARGLVVSMWPVDDEASCLAMVRFYEVLRNKDVGASLADAQAAIRAATEAERTAAFEDLAAAAGVELPDGDRGRRRSWGAAARRKSGDRAHPYYWAPFIHVGV